MKQSKESRVEQSVNGLISNNGLIHTIHSSIELLYGNAEDWFRVLITTFEKYARESAQDPEFGVEMLEMVELINRMITENVVLEESLGIYPQIVSRARIPVWKVDSEERMRSYVHYLVECSSEAVLDAPYEFALIVPPQGKAEFCYTSKLANQAKFMKDFITPYWMEDHVMESFCNMVVSGKEIHPVQASRFPSTFIYDR